LIGNVGIFFLSGALLRGVLSSKAIA